MANLGNTIINGILRVNGKIDVGESITAPSFIGNLTGVSDGAQWLINRGRPTSADLTPSSSSEYGGVRHDIASSAMTTNKPSTTDGHILTFFWDNSGRYDSQLALSNSTENQYVKVRFNSNSAWSQWRDLAFIDSEMTGNAATATKLKDARSITLADAITGTATFDGSKNVTINTKINLPTKTIPNMTTTGYYKIAQVIENDKPWFCRLLIDVKISNTSFQSIMVDVGGSGLNYSITGRILHRYQANYDINYVRVCYPKTVGSGYGTIIDINNNNARSKVVNVTLLEGNNIVLTDIATTTYNSTNYTTNVSNQLNGNGMYGWNTYYSGQADCASFTRGIDSNGDFKAGEALVANDVVALGVDGLFYKITNTEAYLKVKDCFVARVNSAYAVNAGVVCRSLGAYTPLASYTTENEGITSGKTVYIEGTISGESFIPNGKVTCVLTNGKSYMRIGIAKSTTIIYFDKNTYCFTLDENGKIVNYNGSPVGGEDNTKLPLTGGTLTGDLTVSKANPTLKIQASDKANAQLVFDRNGNADWMLQSNSGNFFIKCDYANSTVGDYYDVLKLNYGTGNATFKGTVTATSFSGSLSASNLTNKSAIKGSEITDDKHWIPSSNNTVKDFIFMSSADYISQQSSLPSGTLVALSDNIETYVSTQATGLTCELPLNL